MIVRSKTRVPPEPRRYLVVSSRAKNRMTRIRSSGQATEHETYGKASSRYWFASLGSPDAEGLNTIEATYATFPQKAKRNNRIDSPSTDFRSNWGSSALTRPVQGPHSHSSISEVISK